MIAYKNILSLTVFMMLTGGCGATFDLAYSLGNKKYTDHEEQTFPTRQVHQQHEYSVTVLSKQTLQLNCFSSERRVERGWKVFKTYSYRGGWTKSTYGTTAIVDGIFGSLVAGVAIASCSDNENPYQCPQLAWAAPFAVDIVYSLLRRGAVRKPVLSNRSSSGETMQLGKFPNYINPTGCSEVSDIWLGTTSGSSALQQLNGSNGPNLSIDQGAQEVILDANRFMLIDLAIAYYWLHHTGASIWTRDIESKVRPVPIERCNTLRPFYGQLAPQERQLLDSQCPLPKTEPNR